MIQPVIKKNLSNNAKSNLRQSILQMDLSRSNKLPPEEQLAKELSVSRVTIRSALKDLEQEGLVLRIHGKGTFVNPEARRIKANLGSMMEFSAVIQQNGYIPKQNLLSVSQEPADEFLAHQLRVAQGDRLVRVEKLYFADQIPVILSIAWVARSLFDQPPSRQEWSRLNNFGVLYLHAGKAITHDIVEVSSISKEEMESELQHSTPLSCHSMLCLHACAFDQENEPIIYGKVFYDTSRICFQLFRNQE